jgi:hypothetical protein
VSSPGRTRGHPGGAFRIVPEGDPKIVVTGDDARAALAEHDRTDEIE